MVTRKRGMESLTAAQPLWTESTGVLSATCWGIQGSVDRPGAPLPWPMLLLFED